MMKTKKNKSKFNKQSINTTNPTRTTINSKNQTIHQNLETKILSINKKTTANKENKKPWQKSDLLKPKNSYKHPKLQIKLKYAIRTKNYIIHMVYSLQSPRKSNPKPYLHSIENSNSKPEIKQIIDWIYT